MVEENKVQDKVLLSSPKHRRRFLLPRKLLLFEARFKVVSYINLYSEAKREAKNISGTHPTRSDLNVKELIITIFHDMLERERMTSVTQRTEVLK